MFYMQCGRLQTCLTIIEARVSILKHLNTFARHTFLALHSWSRLLFQAINEHAISISIYHFHGKDIYLMRHIFVNFCAAQDISSA